MSRRHTHPGGAISALSSSETSTAQAPSIETAGAGPRRPASAFFAVLVVAYLVLGALRLRDVGPDVSETVDGR